MDDLVTWLRAQLDEDEREAGQLDHMPACGFSGGCDCLLAERLRRALAEVDAKRRILDVYRAEVIDVSRVPSRPEWVHGRVPVEAHTVLRLLALPYADRPGYRDEWRP